MRGLLRPSVALSEGGACPESVEGWMPARNALACEAGGMLELSQGFNEFIDFGMVMEDVNFFIIPIFIKN